METRLSEPDQQTAEHIQELLLLAERTSGQLDDEAIAAVAEATGTSAEYVRATAQFLPRKKKRNLVAQIRAALLQIEPEPRRIVTASGLGAIGGLFSVLSHLNLGSAGQQFYGTLQLIILGLGIWNSCMARETRAASAAGAAGLGMYFLSQSLFAYVARTDSLTQTPLLPVFLLIGALGGLVAQKLTHRYGRAFGIADPVKEREMLLKQLVDLQAKLRSGEESMTFLSVDVVGSTQMKASLDPLAAEFTFTEYHRYVERVANQFDGRLHSTAGDGVVVAFVSPQNALLAAKNLQLGLVELNNHLMQVGATIGLRVGVHTGMVVTPQAGDIRSVNFAHVIDLASHIQKVCPPGCVAISDSAASAIPGGAAAVSSEIHEVMEQPVRIWRPRVATNLVAKSALAPPSFQTGTDSEPSGSTA